jgi:putative ABC transport system permease protein
MLSQLRYTIRLLFKSPGFTITAVLVLGLGIGANTAVFSLIDTVLLKPLPYPEPERLAWISMPTQTVSDGALDYPDYLDLCAAQHTFSSLGLESWDSFDLSEHGRAERIKGSCRTASAFQVSGLPFVLGRPFNADEDKPGGPLVVVLSETLWRSQFNADPEILGQSIVLNGHSFRVIGVVKPEESETRTPPQVFVPLNSMDVVGDWEKWRGRDNHSLFCFGRLKEGVTLAQAQADLEVIQRHLSAQFPEDRGYGIRVNDALQTEMRDYQPTLWLLGAAAVGLLLISSVNVANLLIVRASDRRRELMIRAAIGGSRFRLIGHLLFESALLSVIGGLLGIPVGFAGIQLIKWAAPADMARVFGVSLNVEAILFCFGLATLTAVVSGLYPALVLSKTNLASALSAEGGRGGTVGPQRRRTQSIMMTCQVSLACVLLIGTGLLARSFEAVQNVPLGFTSHHLLTAEISLVNKKYRDQSQADTFFATLLERVRRMPDVTAATLSDDPPFVNSENGNYTPFTIPDRPLPEPGHEPTLGTQFVSPGYFRAFQTPLLEGRDFDERDQRTSQSVVIINQALAQAFFPDQSPIGKQIELPGSYMTQKRYTVLGVAQDMRHGGPDHQPEKFGAYFPFCQQLTHYEILILRSSGNPLTLLPDLRKTIASIDPEQPLGEASTFDDVMAKRGATRRLGVLLVSVFSSAALLLSTVGLYAVLAYSVSQQTREIGVRIAVGASRRNILGLIVKQGFTIVMIGIVLGLLAASALTNLLGSLLYGVGGNDPITIVASILVLCFAALFACSFPALRAVRIDPITALRE